MERNKGPDIAALAPRTAALFILLWQLRLLASDMADTPYFIAALAGAFLAAVFLSRKKMLNSGAGPFPAVIILALVPWTIRSFVALPRFFISGVTDTAILLDSLLLNLDRNNFSALLPFYWVSVTSYFCMRSRVFLRADIIAADALFLVLFSIAPSASLDAYRWPVLMIAVFALVLFLQILSLVLSVPPELKLRRREKTLAGIFLFLLVLSGGVFFIRPFQERAVEKGGGLLEPKLFRFDFSQILRLESEISVNDDLVLIVKKDTDYTHVLLRRYTLSGYGVKQGFFRLDDIDEAAHPKNLPGKRVLLPSYPGSEAGMKNYRVAEQEYYLVNFDASAFIGMNTPVEIVPFETWDASSFNSAYAVKSRTSEAMPFELIDAVRDVHTGDVWKGLSAEEYALYTEYGGDGRIASFARSIIRGSSPPGEEPGYWEQIQKIYERLKFGEYRYSFKPGIAPDGDQLSYFLFDSKKGYCSYYAFAFTLLLRSLGIPCRVAAGFMVDPFGRTFNYYPVRSDMAHAWVEVWFPEYGWIEYDPTTDILAEGEEFRFSQGTPPELFERLLKEILDNRSQLRMREGEDAENTGGDLAALGRRAMAFLAKEGPYIAAAALALFFLSMRASLLWLALLQKSHRKKAAFLWAHVKRRLAFAGHGRTGTAASGLMCGEAEWAREKDGLSGGLYALYLDSAAARFAPVYTPRDSREMTEHYLLWNGAYRRAIHPGRRLLAWLLPPLALILPAKRIPAKQRFRAKSAVMLIMIIFTLRGEMSRAQDVPPVEGSGQEAGELYRMAFHAEGAENWERAIELYSRGAKAYPHDFRFPWSLGNIYYHRQLYRLAWDEYLKAEKNLSGESSDQADAILLYSRLANTAGYLNRNDVSAGYLERVLDLDNDNREAIGILSWMYFKLHRLEDGERLLLDAMERLGHYPEFSMTLGTIYSDMFQYREAKQHYLDAIREAASDRFSVALAYYNLSILESRYYQYSLAHECTDASLEAMDRASGRLARGELYMRRMELPRALAEYQEAYNRADSSPLSKLNLAIIYETGGRLTESRLYAEDCLKAGDLSWMINFGIDPIRYKRDIHEVLKNSYEGLYRAEPFGAPGTVKEGIQSLFRRVSYRFRWAVHTHLFRKYSLLSANAYAAFRTGESSLEAMIQYFNAFENYPRRALSYLRHARGLEEPIIPGSTPTYNYDEGCLLKNRELLLASLAEFDPLWERDMIAKTYAELFLLGKKAERHDAAERLFAINRGALLSNGIRLPADLRISAENAGSRRTLESAAKAAGLEKARGSSPRYTLTLSVTEGGEVSCELYDGGRGITLYNQTLPLPSRSGAQKAAFVRFLRNGIFNAF